MVHVQRSSNTHFTTWTTGNTDLRSCDCTKVTVRKTCSEQDEQGRQIGVVMEMIGFHGNTDAWVHLWLGVKIMCTCEKTVLHFQSDVWRLIGWFSLKLLLMWVFQCRDRFLPWECFTGKRFYLLENQEQQLCKQTENQVTLQISVHLVLLLYI